MIYPEETARGLDDAEDHFSQGALRLRSLPRHPGTSGPDLFPRARV
jgi:hypothetical protein